MKLGNISKVDNQESKILITEQWMCPTIKQKFLTGVMYFILYVQLYFAIAIAQKYII